MRKELITKREVLRAIREAKEVVIMPRFGTAETWLKIAKAEAKAFIAGLPEVAPEEMEMFGGHFAVLEEGTLYLG